MAMDEARTGSRIRHDMIVGAVNAELERQARSGAPRIDIEALASAIEGVLDKDRTPPIFSEGVRPEELDATNDD